MVVMWRTEKREVRLEGGDASVRLCSPPGRDGTLVKGSVTRDGLEKL